MAINYMCNDENDVCLCVYLCSCLKYFCKFRQLKIKGG